MRAIKIIGSVICLLAVLLATFYQFKMSSIWPLIFASLFIMPIRWLRPGFAVRRCPGEANFGEFGYGDSCGGSGWGR